LLIPPNGNIDALSQNPSETLKQFNALLHASATALIRSSIHDNLITSWSTGAVRLYKHRESEALGQPMTLLVPPELYPEAEAIRARVEGGEQIVNWPTVQITRDGERIDTELSIFPVKGDAGQVTSAWTLVRDISRQMQTERDLVKLRKYTANRLVVLETANRVALDILASRTGVEALRHIAEAARTLSKARYAALGVARIDGPGLMEFVTTGLTMEEEARIGPRPDGRGLLGLLLERTEPLRVDVLASHAASSGFPPDHPPMASFLGVPIRRGDVVLGSLYLTNKEGGGPFTEADEALVQALGAHAAIAIYSMQQLSRQRALLRSLILGQEEERRAVAYDLHDGLTQYVVASHAHLQTARRLQDCGDPVNAKGDMAIGMDYLEHAVVESRRLVNGLRSLTLDDLGLAGALEQLLQDEKMRAGWHQTQFIHNVEGIRYDVSLETTAYRVAQEALTNVRKHSLTNRVRITLLGEKLDTGQEMLRLEIQDWGTGFVPEDKLRNTERVGLHSMAERVGIIGGTYTLQSSLESGTMITALFPAMKPAGDEF